MIRYSFREDQITIAESYGEEDITVSVTLKDDQILKRFKELRSAFDKDKRYTDVMFYTHQDGHYEIILQRDHYLHFFLEAFRFRIIESISWENE